MLAHTTDRYESLRNTNNLQGRKNQSDQKYVAIIYSYKGHEKAKVTQFVISQAKDSKLASVKLDTNLHLYTLKHYFMIVFWRRIRRKCQEKGALMNMVDYEAEHSLYCWFEKLVFQ